MTDREKAIVMAYTGITTLSGDKIKEFYKYLAELYGRPVYTHEIAILDIPSKAMQDFIELCMTEEKEEKEKWIPVKMRPMDSEEREYWEEHTGFTLTDDIAQTFDCPMPDDGQRIWVQTKNGFIFDDVCDSDCDGIGLEGNGDWDDIIAWMPMSVPEPWKGEKEE